MKNLFIIGLLCTLTLSINVPTCGSDSYASLSFTYINGQPDDTTSATLCHDNENLYVQWRSIDKEIIANYENCNDPLWQQDVVEIFISTTDSYPLQYFEFEVSPKSKLFFADITNYNGDCSSLGDQFFDCGAAEYGAKLTEKGWDAWFKIRLDIIGRGQAQTRFMVNVLRVDYTTNEPIRYLTWQPTYADPACFHKPAYFQEIILV